MRERILVVGRHEHEDTVLVYQAITRARHRMLAESCKRAAELVDALPILNLVIICGMTPDEEEAPLFNAAWLADVISKSRADLAIMIITDESRTAPLYSEAELTGARMVAWKGLTKEALLTQVEEALLDTG